MTTCFMDREQSWLAFNLRVLKEAEDKNVPLMERIKFLSIYNSNLDEFFMVRMGTIMHREALFPEGWDIKTGWTSSVQLKKASNEVRRQQETAERIYEDLVLELAEKGIDIVDFRNLSRLEESVAKKIFSEIKPLLSPQVVDGGHPLPFLWNKEIYLAASLAKKDTNILGFVSLAKIPKYRAYEVNGRQKIIIISELIRHFSKNIFKKYDVKESVLIKVTRNADIFLEDFIHGDYDFRRSMEAVLRKRNRELPIRLQISGKCSENFKELLVQRVEIENRYVYNTSSPLDIGFSSEIDPLPGMKYEKRNPVKNVKLKKGQYFKYLKNHDLLLSYPYQSMMPFIDMLYEAADDPDVHSIKITLYRLSQSSKIAAALSYAADKGKEVICLLELRARFDEQSNIDYSQMLENAGCKIIYGLAGYKVHSKLCLITRKNGKDIEYITQVGTGNYNESTSEQYADLSMITSDKKTGEDAVKIFNSLSLGILPVKTESLLVAPYSFKMPILELMEIERAKGKNGHIAIKVNSLNDMDIMNKMIECSNSGVEVELFIRGICCLKPGIKGYTENIKVYSVVGRYLEHSRIFVFGKGDERRIFTGSGDLLNRNTRRRVEVFIEAKEGKIKNQILEVMDAFRDDNEKKWIMNSDGTYEKPEKIKKGTSSQDRLYEYFSKQIIDEKDIERSPLKDFLKKIFSGS